MRVELTLIKIVNKKVYLTLDYKYAKSIGATGTTIRNGFWVPRLAQTISSVVEYYGGEDQVNEDILDLLYTLRAEADLGIEAINTNKKVYHEWLREYQNIGVGLIREHKSFGLFWDPRTGKTPTTILALEEVETFKKVLIAVPSGMPLTWKHEFEIWSTRDNVVVLSKSIKKRVKQYEEFKKSDDMVLVGAYQTMASDVDFTFKKKKALYKHEGIWTPEIFDLLILDEAHFLRNETTRQSKGINALRKFSKNAVALTGTPATNEAYDVLPILNFIYPGQYPKWPLIDYFFDKHQTRYSLEIGSVLPERYAEWVEMLSLVSQQIKMKEVNKWIPEVVESVEYIQMTPAQEKIYKEMINDYRITDETGDVIVREQNKLTQMGALIRLGLDPRIKDVNVKGAKTEWLKNYFKENKGKPTIIVSPATAYLDLLNEELFDGKASMITGSVSSKDKTKAVEDFQAGATDVILLNTVAGATGWTLDRADTTIFTNLDWNPTNNTQISQRMIPTKEENVRGKKEIIYLDVELSTRSKGDQSMDELVRFAIQNKLSKTEIVNNYTKWIRKQKEING